MHSGEQILTYLTSYAPCIILHCVYRVIRKSVKHLKNSQQMDYGTDRGNSYVDRERNC